MKALHKVVVTGAFGALGGAAIAGSGAFACTATANITVKDAGGTSAAAVVRPGQQVDVAIKNFYDPAVAGPELGAGSVQVAWQTEAGVTTPMVSSPGPSFTVQLSIPAEVVAGSRYYLVAQQFGADGTLLGRDSKPVFIAGTTPKAAVPAEPVNAPAVSTENPAPNNQAVAPQAPSAATRNAPSAAPSAPGPATAPRASSPAVVSAPVAVAPGVVATPAQPATPAVPTAVVLPAPAAQALPAPADLWSGLDAGRSPSLLEATAPASQSSSFPVGGVLLGGGVVALAGVAVAATRRRLALARR